MATPASSPAHFRVTIAFPTRDVPGTWMQKTGGHGASEVRRFKPGGDPNDEVSAAPGSREDVVVTREWRRDRDLDLYRWMDARRGRVRGTVIVQPLDDDYKPYGDPIVHADALLLACTMPDVDSDGGTEVAQITATFAVSGEVA